MSAPEMHRDLSQLSALLATKTAPVSAKPKTARALTPANDNKPVRFRLAWPTFERLAHRGDYSRLYALRHWKNLNFPGSEIDVPEEGNYDPEVAIEIRPSEGELLAAVGWEIVDRERWYWTNEMVNIYQPKPSVETHQKNRNGGTDTSLGALLVRDGKLIQWGETKKGAALKPVERARGVKGGVDPSRSESAIRAYLELSGAVSPFTSRPYAKPISAEPAIRDYYDPLPREEPSPKDRHGRFGVSEAREVLRRFGVDGRVPFDQLPVPATRCENGLVAGPQWIGGIKKPKPLGEISSSAGREPEFVRQVETVSYLDYLRRRLREHATVLDHAITDASAKSIGMAMGQAPAYAEKRGPALIDAAIDALIAIDETARGEFVPTKEKIAA
ncbi:hypothetical protein [Rhizobium ruizarguesonis]|uniref:hypothetical protein n=1 Tax=Rhizobium ruizarguesonis TaxID=2081791 RepID=UPI00102FC2D6|nr:hypothetical protein [Rhizobium ruizarguesonis]TBC12316.1 hypothetical protein ELH37_13395 [Rhizobium ruizarguesonis]TBC58081.1 hypothetical protein ELH32_13700 [Rhizobium ruizarguesonis]